MILHPVDFILSLVLLSVLFSYSAGRVPTLIKLICFQGIVVSIVPFFAGHEMTSGGTAFTLATLVIRGIVIPFSIYIAVKRVEIQRDVGPIIGYRVSILCGLVIIVAAAFVSQRLNFPMSSLSSLWAAASIALLITGMFLVMARRNAIAMVIGYIMMENGIYLIGSGFSARTRHIVEFGILLDVLAGVMIMAVILQNIKKTFDDVDTTLLRTLKD